MTKIILAVCCLALMGSVTAATAKTGNGMTRPMDSNARMMKKHKMMKSHGMMSGESKEGMAMKKGGMSK